MRSDTPVLQPLLSLSGTGTDGLEQPAAGWLDVTNFRWGGFLMNVYDVNNATLHLETAVDDTDTSTAFQGVAQTATGGDHFAAIDSSATTPLLRWLRWRVESGAGAWSITFRVAAVLK